MLGTNIATNASAPYASGQYAAASGNLSTTGSTVPAGYTCLAPGIIRKSVRIASLCVRLTTAAASGNVQLSLYAADPLTNKPTGAPLFTSASQSTAATGLIEVAASLTLSPGVYWLGKQVDTNGATAVFTSVGNGTTLMNELGMLSNSNFLAAAGIVGYNKSGTFGTWPTYTGTGTGADGLSEVSSSGGVALWGFKAA